MIPNKIIFFNHFHRGDLFIHKEFIRQIKREMPKNVTFEYWHYNHPKCNADLEIPLTRLPETLDRQVPFYVYADGSTLLVNTWIGVWSDIFAKCAGINYHSLTQTWAEIFNKINEVFGTSLTISKTVEDYIPTIDFKFFDTRNIDDWLFKHRDNKKVLFCNGKPMSSQSFDHDMSAIINELAKDYPKIDFICTKKFESNEPNVYFTDHIIRDTMHFPIKVFWVEGDKNICDLNEISYLSTKCNAIVGKNSGPFVYCETKENYMNPNMRFLTFNIGLEETLSNGVEFKALYSIITDHHDVIVKSVINKLLYELNDAKILNLL
jgi:hypothetical protein